jgi:hypothetical protein
MADEYAAINWRILLNADPGIQGQRIAMIVLKQGDGSHQNEIPGK